MMKHNLVTVLGVVAILAGIVVVRSVYEQSPKTDADTKEVEEVATQLEEAAEITEKAEAAAAPVAQEEAAPKAEEMVLAQAEAGTAPVETPPETPATKSIDDFEEIAEWPAEAPDVFRVKFDGTTGPYVIEVQKAWAPIGAERFYELCKIGFFNDAGYFRAIEDFMVQFGLAADPKLSAQYRSKRIQDDPVRKSNQRGMITFAKSGQPNSRTTQVFISYRDNSRLDLDGFAPFGEVIFGMDSVDKINKEYGAKSNNQAAIEERGNAFLKENFPNLDYVTKVTLVK